MKLLRRPAATPAAATATSTEAPARFHEHVSQGDHARDAGDWGGAIAHYEAALRAKPTALGIGVQLGHCFKEAGQFREAESHYKAFLAAHPDDADIHLQLGHLKMKQGHVEEAGPWYEKALALAPDDQIAGDAQRELARCADAPLEAKRRQALSLIDRRRFADAYQRLAPLVETHGCTDLTAVLGNVCKELGRFDEARSWYERRRALPDGSSPDIAFDTELQLGHLAKAERDYAGALNHFRSASAELPYTRSPSCTGQELDSELRACLAQITSAIALG